MLNSSTLLLLLLHAVTGTKVFVMPGGMMKSNANLVDLIEKVKPEIRTLIEKCNTVSNVSHIKQGPDSCISGLSQ